MQPTFTQRRNACADMVANMLRPHKDNDKRMKALEKRHGGLFHAYRWAVEKVGANHCIASIQALSDELVSGIAGWPTLQDLRQRAWNDPRKEWEL